jgi:hypothetical protein
VRKHGLEILIPEVTGLVTPAGQRYSGIMSYPDGGGLTAATERLSTSRSNRSSVTWRRSRTSSARSSSLSLPSPPSRCRRSLANLADRNLTQLTALLKTWLKRTQHRPGLLGGFLASTDLDLTPFP